MSAILFRPYWLSGKSFCFSALKGKEKQQYIANELNFPAFRKAMSNDLQDLGIPTVLILDAAVG